MHIDLQSQRVVNLSSILQSPTESAACSSMFIVLPSLTPNHIVASMEHYPSLCQKRLLCESSWITQHQSVLYLPRFVVREYQGWQDWPRDSCTMPRLEMNEYCYIRLQTLCGEILHSREMRRNRPAGQHSYCKRWPCQSNSFDIFETISISSDAKRVKASGATVSSLMVKLLWRSSEGDPDNLKLQHFEYTSTQYRDNIEIYRIYVLEYRRVWSLWKVLGFQGLIASIQDPHPQANAQLLRKGIQGQSLCLNKGIRWEKAEKKLINDKKWYEWYWIG